MTLKKKKEDISNPYLKSEKNSRYIIGGVFFFFAVNVFLKVFPLFFEVSS